MLNIIHILLLWHNVYTMFTCIWISFIMDKIIVLDYLWHQFQFKWIRPCRTIHLFIVSLTNGWMLGYKSNGEDLRFHLSKILEISLLFQLGLEKRIGLIFQVQLYPFHIPRLSNKIEKDQKGKSELYAYERRKTINRSNQQIYI